MWHSVPYELDTIGVHIPRAFHAYSEEGSHQFREWIPWARRPGTHAERGTVAVVQGVRFENWWLYSSSALGRAHPLLERTGHQTLCVIDGKEVIYISLLCSIREGSHFTLHFLSAIQFNTPFKSLRPCNEVRVRWILSQPTSYRHYSISILPSPDTLPNRPLHHRNIIRQFPDRCLLNKCITVSKEQKGIYWTSLVP